ncbi:MAG: Mrp/NBP35 family ATP-binding protein [Thermoflexales bacterium]
MLKNLFARRPPPVTVDQVMAALTIVLDPEANRDIVSLGMVKNVAARDGVVSFAIRLREAGSPLQVPIERRARKSVGAIPGVSEVRISFETDPRSELRDTKPLAELEIRHVIAVASGKGGVGKSTVAVNLACGLAKLGQRVGLLDGDIHGPNVPLMMGIAGEQPFAFGDRIFPPQAHGVTVMSMGLMVPAEAPVIWRGPMLHQAIRQLLRDVMWGELDFLIVDLPPGTGDAQLTLIQSMPLAGVALVTTPQDVALSDAIRGGEMFRQLDVPVLGLVENMSYYECANCGGRDYIFGEGGGARLAEKMGVPLLAQIPIHSAIRAGGDAGMPAVIGAPESPAGLAFLSAARAIAAAASARPALKSTTSKTDPQLKIMG